MGNILNLINPTNPINTIGIFDFYKIIDKIKYSKIKVANKLKKICTEQVVQVSVNKIINYRVVGKSISNKTVYALRLIIQDYTVCLYFDINNKKGIRIYLSCDIISSKNGRDDPSSFTINFTKNIAEDNYISKQDKNIVNRKSIFNYITHGSNGLFNIHIILLLCRIFGVSKYIRTNQFTISDLVKNKKTYLQKIGFVPLYKKKYNETSKIISKLTIDKYKKAYYKKYGKYPPNMEHIKGKYLFDYIDNSSDIDKQSEFILTAELIVNMHILNICNIFYINYVKYNFKHETYTKKYFDTYDLQYIEN